MVVGNKITCCIHDYEGQYFVAYDNGKSAVRVPKNHDKSGLTHVAVPASVHKFHIKEASVSPRRPYMYITKKLTILSLTIVQQQP